MTKLRRYKSAAEFLNETMPFLARDEALNNLMLFNALRLRERADSADASVYMSAVVGSRGAVLAAMKLPGYALNIYCLPIWLIRPRTAYTETSAMSS